MGTLMKKIHRQEAASTSSPPRLGPSASEMPLTPPQKPMALPRSSGGKTLAMIDRVLGIIMAPPSPWTARKPISHPIPGARPQASEARVKTHSPTMKTALRP